MSKMMVDDVRLEVDTFRGMVEVILDQNAHEGGYVYLSVEEAVQFSRMIVKAAAEAAGLETASEALSGADPTGDTRTP